MHNEVITIPEDMNILTGLNRAMSLPGFAGLGVQGLIISVENTVLGLDDVEHTLLGLGFVNGCSHFFFWGSPLWRALSWKVLFLAQRMPAHGFDGFLARCLLAAAIAPGTDRLAVQGDAPAPALHFENRL